MGRGERKWSKSKCSPGASAARGSCPHPPLLFSEGTWRVHQGPPGALGILSGLYKPPLQSLRIAHLDPFPPRSTVSPEARSPHPRVFSTSSDPGPLAPGLCPHRPEWLAVGRGSVEELQAAEAPVKQTILPTPVVPISPGLAVHVSPPSSTEGQMRSCMGKRLTGGSPHPKSLLRTLLLRKRQEPVPTPAPEGAGQGIMLHAYSLHRNPAASYPAVREELEKGRPASPHSLPWPPWSGPGLRDRRT